MLNLTRYYRCFFFVIAHDVMYNYLQNMCRKPVRTNPRDHVARILTIYCYVGKLLGTANMLDEAQQKSRIFKSFRRVGEFKYERSGRNLGTDTMQGIVDFTGKEKGYADREQNK